MKKLLKMSTIDFLLLLILGMFFGMNFIYQNKNIDPNRKALKELKDLLRKNPSSAEEMFLNKVTKKPKCQVSEAALDSLGYYLIKQNQISEAVVVFHINTKLFPNSWKAWDSLGEGYMYMNDDGQCRVAYQTSLEINPENRNASKQLRNLEEFMYGMVCETETFSKFSPGESTGIDQPYFGQSPPDDVPMLFAPGIVSTRGNLEYSCTFSPDGREMFFCARIGKNIARMFHSRWEKGGWTFPEIPASSEGHIDYLPYIMPDGMRMFFGRIKKDENGAVISNGLYTMNKDEENPLKWSEPYLFADGEGWMHVSATQDQTIYTTYLPTHKTTRFRLVEGRYPQRETLQGGLHPGGHPSIAPDERYIVFDSERERGFGRGDLWVSFRTGDRTWEKGINLGENVNTPGNESIPHITPDGRYLFYTSNRDIYWVGTEFIDRLK